MLRFGSVRALRDRLSGLSCVAAALLVACSVFPDEAVLPAPSGGSANEGGLPTAEGGAGSSAGAQGGEPGVLPLGGSGTGGSAGSASGGSAVGGEDPGQAGGGGAVTQTCVAPQQYSATTTLDFWIGSADESANHGSESALHVNGVPDERRAMFSVTVPAAPAGSVLLKAEIALNLASNADASRAARQLGLYLQTPLRAVVEGKATWLQYGANKNKDVWATPGGDLSERVTTTDIPAGTTSGMVRFDVTEAVRSVLGASPQVYGIVILEEGPAPAAPAELAFTSFNGEDSVSPAPSLLLRYCQP